MEFKETLKLLMTKNNVTNYRLALDLNTSKTTIANWLNGISTPAMKILQKIADYFGVSVDYLYGMEKEPNNVYPVETITVFDEIGSVAAGYDSLAVENLTGKKIEIPTSMLGGRPKSDFFILKVKGNSMYPRLLEGDDILCLRCDSVDSGDYAVILYNSDEATVKQVRYVYGEDWLELIPANPEYAPKRIVGADLQQCKVLGKVIKLIREF